MTSTRSKLRRTQGERSETTTRTLVAKARDLFATRGFAATSLDDILERARLTRGALYHHFESKTDLFRAVVEDEERALAKTIAVAASQEPDAWHAVSAGCMAFLEACVDPKLQRLLLVDGPSVLGIEEMRELEARYTWALLRSGLERAMDEGCLARRRVEPLTHLLLGALSHAAMSIARAKDQGAMLADTKAEVARLLRAVAVASAP